ncbi:MAG: hypothetical protein QXO74_06740 [Candidatus Methanomethylicia archaeon]
MKNFITFQTEENKLLTHFSKRLHISFSAYHLSTYAFTLFIAAS